MKQRGGNKESDVRKALYIKIKEFNYEQKTTELIYSAQQVNQSGNQRKLGAAREG